MTEQSFDARDRLNRLREIRLVARQCANAMSQREIADALGITQPRVMRILKAIELRGLSLDDAALQTPEEIILEATVNYSDRSEMVERLKEFTYTLGESAPYAHDGYVPGSWDQVLLARAQGYLSEAEFEEICAAVRQDPTHDSAHGDGVG